MDVGPVVLDSLLNHVSHILFETLDDELGCAVLISGNTLFRRSGALYIHCLDTGLPEIFQVTKVTDLLGSKLPVHLLGRFRIEIPNGNCDKTPEGRKQLFISMDNTILCELDLHLFIEFKRAVDLLTRRL